MEDIQLVFNGITLVGSIVVIIGAFVTVYVYWSWMRFARGEWTIRNVTFYPAEAVKRVFKIEFRSWENVDGVTNITETVTVVPPAVVVHFIIVNPSIIPAAINEVKLVMTRLSDGSSYKFAASHASFQIPQ